jgi:hypothetical protein
MQMHHPAPAGDAPVVLELFLRSAPAMVTAIEVEGWRLTRT